MESRISIDGKLGLLLFSLASIFPTGSIFAATAPRSWFEDDQMSGGQKSLSSFEEANEEFIEEVDKLYTAQGDSYDRLLKESTQAHRSHSAWELTQIRSQLALSANGTIGILALQGGIAAELRWYRKNRSRPEFQFKNTKELAHEEDAIDASFHSDLSDSEISMTLEKIAETAHGSGKISNKTEMLKGLKKAVSRTKSMMIGIKTLPSGPWVPYLFRFRVVFRASGSPIEGLSVGGDLMVRFEWRLAPKASKDAKDAKPTVAAKNRRQETFQDLVQALSHDMKIFVNREPFGNSWGVKNFQILLGQNINGTIGIAKLGSTYLGRLYFIRRTKAHPPTLGLSEQTIKDSDKPIHLVTGQNTEKSLGRASQEIQLNRSKMRHGLRKAEKIASFFMKRAGKNKQKYWKLKVVRTDFIIGLGGSIGLATLNGFGELRVEYIDHTW